MQPIYIADDSADQRYLLGHYIKRIYPDSPIVAFERAQALIDSLALAIETEAELPQVIFLDLQMPDMDGYTALILIKQRSADDIRWAEIPIAIFSGNNDKDVVQRCLDAGALAFLQKPVDLEELKNLLILTRS